MISRDKILFVVFLGTIGICLCGVLQMFFSTPLFGLSFFCEAFGISKEDFVGYNLLFIAPFLSLFLLIPFFKNKVITCVFACMLFALFFFSMITLDNINSKFKEAFSTLNVVDLEKLHNNVQENVFFAFYDSNIKGKIDKKKEETAGDLEKTLSLDRIVEIFSEQIGAEKYVERNLEGTRNVQRQ